MLLELRQLIVLPGDRLLLKDVIPIRKKPATNAMK